MKYFTLIVCVFLFWYSTANAQIFHSMPKDSLEKLYKQPKQNIIKTNPFVTLISQNPLTGEFRLVYEMVSGMHQSAYFGISYLYANFITKQFFENYKDTTGIHLVMNGFRGQAGYKFYLSKKELAPYGIYVGPFASYSVTKVNPRGVGNNYVNIYYMNANMVFGWQFFVIDKFAVDFYTGVGYRYNYARSYNRFFGHEEEPLNSGFKFALGINFGYAF